MTNDSKIFRILDVNFNRSREGLRVCEEVFRLVIKNKAMTGSLKSARHDISNILKSSPLLQPKLIKARNIKEDFGKKPSNLENDRTDISSLFFANMERSKESLRVLEEMFKLLDVKVAVQFKKIRFKVYAIEKRALPHLEALRHHR